MSEQNVGDINSEEKGSGARFNAGKPPMELIPVGVFASVMRQKYMVRSVVISIPEINKKVVNILLGLGEWQKGNYSIPDIMTHLDDADWLACARVFDYGRKKYAEWNWAKGMKWSIPVACIMRHSQSLLSGEINDWESNLPHIGHIACNLVMLAQFSLSYPEGDDRPIKYLSSTINGSLDIDNPTFNMPTIYEHNVIKTT